MIAIPYQTFIEHSNNSEKKIKNRIITSLNLTIIFLRKRAWNNPFKTPSKRNTNNHSICNICFTIYFSGGPHYQILTFHEEISPRSKNQLCLCRQRASKTSYHMDERRPRTGRVRRIRTRKHFPIINLKIQT